MTLPPPPDARPPRAKQRGSVLLVAMLIATAVGIGLAGYLNLSYNELKLAQRTFYLNDSANLAEAGLEEAVYCFRLASAGTATSTAWSGWTLSGNNASLILPSFNRSQNAVCTVKVYVTGYNGSSGNSGATGAVVGNGSNGNNNASGTGTSTTTSTSSIIAQATIALLDGSPTVMKTLKVTLSGTSSSSNSTSSGTGNGGTNQTGSSSGTGAIPVGTTTTTTWKLTKWYDLQGTSESLTLSTTTGGFLK